MAKHFESETETELHLGEANLEVWAEPLVKGSDGRCPLKLTTFSYFRD